MRASDQKSNRPLFPKNEKVFHMVAELASLLNQINEKRAKLCGLGVPGFKLLSLIAAQKENDLTVTQAARHLKVKPQALNRPLNQLIKANFVVKKNDIKDTRSKRITITEKGQERLLVSDSLLEKVCEEINTNIPAENVAVLVLERLEDAFLKAIEKTDQE